MSESSRFSVTLQRIEVRIGVDPSDNEEEHLWAISVWPAQEGSVLVAGYLRLRSTEGFGQAQSIGVVRDIAQLKKLDSPKGRSAFAEWVTHYAAEALYDNTRRALQAQSALMDFQFDLATSAPDVQVEFPDIEGAFED